MAITAQEYQNAYLKLLPTGNAWNKEAGSKLDKIASAHGAMLARTEQAAESLMSEAIPDNALILLKDWEAFAGVPDCEIDADVTIQVRQDFVATKLKMTGGTSREQLIKQLKSNGYEVEIIDRYPHHCERDVDYPLYAQTHWYLAFIKILNIEKYYMTVNDNVETELEYGDYGNLECLLERYKEAHINYIYIED